MRKDEQTKTLNFFLVLTCSSAGSRSVTPLLERIMVPTSRIKMNSSYYYEYRENIHLGVELTQAVLDCV